MTKEKYLSISKYFRENQILRTLIIWMDGALTKIVFASYPVLMIYLFFQSRMGDLCRTIMIPAISFAAVSGFRRIYCARRPYEIWNIPPILHKETKGNSFPSRHVFSIYMIGMTYEAMLPGFGVPFFAAGILLALIRVVGGVHFIKDVVCGAGIAVLCGLFFYI